MSISRDPWENLNSHALQNPHRKIIDPAADDLLDLLSGKDSCPVDRVNFFPDRKAPLGNDLPSLHAKQHHLSGTIKARRNFAAENRNGQNHGPPFLSIIQSNKKANSGGIRFSLLFQPVAGKGKLAAAGEGIAKCKIIATGGSRIAISPFDAVLLHLPP
jgi:hypothetical protein